VVRYGDVYDDILRAIRGVVNPGKESVPRAARKAALKADPSARVRYDLLLRIPPVMVV
jgi:hypothetical protein